MRDAHDLQQAAQSILTAQSIAHHRLHELGDDSHEGTPSDCQRPLCVRLRQDSEVVAAAARRIR